MKGWYIFHLNVNSLLPKIIEISFIAKQPNSLITGISEIKLDLSILNKEVDIEGFDVMRMEQSSIERRGSCMLY